MWRAMEAGRVAHSHEGMKESKKNQSKEQEGMNQSYNATRRAVVKVFFWIALESIDFPIISTNTAML